MSKNIFLKSTLAGAFLATVCSIGAWAQAPPTPTITDGRYTVNSYGHTNGRNFRTFAELATALSGAELAKDVTIDVVLYHSPGNDRVNQKFTYVENQPFKLTKWKSNGYHVTLNGHGEGLRVIRPSTTPSTSLPIAAIELEGVCDFTLNNLVIDEANSSTDRFPMRGIWIRPSADGTPANNVTISNCIIRNDNKEGCETCAYEGVNPMSYQPRAAGIVVSSQDGTLSSHNGAVAKNCHLEYNEINGGYWGIAMAGTSASTGNRIIGNFLSNIRGIGIKIQEVPGLLIQGNTMRSIHKTDDLSDDAAHAYTANRSYKRPYQGISIQGNTEQGGMPGLVIDGNDLMDFRGPFGYGISLVDVAEARISNNIVAGFKQVKKYNPDPATGPANGEVSGNMLAMFCQSSNHLDIVHNTLIMDAMTTPVGPTANASVALGPQVRALYIRGHPKGDNADCEYVEDITIKDNIIAYAGDGLANYTEANSNQIDYGIATFSEVQETVYNGMTQGIWPNFDYNFFYHTPETVSNGAKFTSLVCRGGNPAQGGGSTLRKYENLTDFQAAGAVGYQTNSHSFQSNAALVGVFNKNFTQPVNTERGDYHLKDNPSIASNSPDQIRNLVGDVVTSASVPTDLYALDIDGNLRAEFAHIVVGADQVPVPDTQPRPAGSTTLTPNSQSAQRTFQLELSPNPLDQRMLQMSVRTQQAGAATLTVLDGLGRLVKTQAVTLTAGEQAVKVDLGTLPKGTYFVRLVQGRQQTTQQLQKR